MAKQSLGNMVKEEAQKVNESEVQTVEAEVVSTEVQEEGTETPQRRKNPTKADLEVQITELTSQITELTSALEISRENEESLQEKVLHLQSEVEEKVKLIAQLQEELKRNDVTEELEKAQKAAFQLSENNAKLMAELEAIKTEQQQLKAHQKPQAQPVQKAKLPQLIRRPDHVQNQPKTSSDDFSQSTWLL
ncbi:MAG: hypothetical protein ACOVQ7_06955 [Limnoraphis robusta]|jgi:chromosome segregation ATPase